MIWAKSGSKNLAIFCKILIFFACGGLKTPPKIFACGGLKTPPFFFACGEPFPPYKSSFRNPKGKIGALFRSKTALYSAAGEHFEFVRAKSSSKCIVKRRRRKIHLPSVTQVLGSNRTQLPKYLGQIVPNYPLRPKCLGQIVPNYLRDPSTWVKSYPTTCSWVTIWAKSYFLSQNLGHISG